MKFSCWKSDLHKTAPETTGQDKETVPQFTRTLSKQGLKLERDCMHTLQVNLGLLCKQNCCHCHLDAGPGRKEAMTVVSVSWDGFLYDCDFNIAAGLYIGNRKIHISEMTVPPERGEMISTAEHCYACTAGSGFT